MDSNNRINPTSVVPTIARQTPKNDFGDVLVRTVGNGVSAVGGIVSGVARGNPVLSAAVSAVSTVAGIAQSAQGITSVGGGAGIGSVGGTAASTNNVPGAAESGLGSFNGQLSQEAADSKVYLQMQLDMQRESREFQAISNIIKVRHDSAKAAINNIR